MVTLQEVKQYMQIETDADDALIARIQQSAVQYLANAGIQDTAAVGMESDALYALAVCALCLYWYDNRAEMANADKLPLGLRTVIQQLKFLAVGTADSDIVPPDAGNAGEEDAAPYA